MPGREPGCRAGRNGGGQPVAAFRQPSQHCEGGWLAKPAPRRNRRTQFSVNWGTQRAPTPTLPRKQGKERLARIPTTHSAPLQPSPLRPLPNPPLLAGEGRVGAMGRKGGRRLGGSDRGRLARLAKATGRPGRPRSRLFVFAIFLVAERRVLREVLDLLFDHLALAGEEGGD